MADKDFNEINEENIAETSDELLDGALLDEPVLATTEEIAKTIADINDEPKQKKRSGRRFLMADSRLTVKQIFKKYKNATKDEQALYRYVMVRKVMSKGWPLLRFFIVFGLAFVVMYPILYMISTAIRPQEQMNDLTVMWIPTEIRWENFNETWAALSYPSTIGTTLMLNIVSSVLSVASCALTGYGFARFKFKGSKFLFWLVIMQIIVPPQILLFPQYFNFRYFDIFGIFNALGGDTLNLIDTPFVMYIPAIFANGIRAGLFILLFRQFFKGLPKELEDAAYLDGCGPFETFVRIMVPNASSSFLTVFIFSIVWYWNDYYNSTIFFNKTRTISAEIAGMAASFPRLILGQDVPAQSVFVWMQAGCILAIAPIIIMYIFLQKYFTEGVERSGLVG